MRPEAVLCGEVGPAVVLEHLEPRLLLEGAISGTVMDYTSRLPLADIEISLYDTALYADAGTALATATSTSDGSYSFTGLSAGNYCLEVSSGASGDDYTYLQALAEYVEVVDGETAEQDLLLHRAGTLYGYVTDTGGNPIEGAVAVVLAEYAQGLSPVHVATTDANGRYELLLPLSYDPIYPIKVATVEGTAYTAQIGPGLYAAEPGGTHGPDFQLAPGATLTGRVVTSDGDPVYRDDEMPVLMPLLTVDNGELNAPVAMPDQNGYFSLVGVPAGVDIYLKTFDQGWENFEVNGKHYAWGQRWLGPFNLEVGETYDIGTVTVPRAGALQVTVTDAEGMPVVGASVQVVGVDQDGGYVSIGHTGSASTDESGQLQLDAVPPGEMLLVVRKEGYLDYVHPEYLTISSGETTTVSVVLSDARTGFLVRGRVGNFAEAAPKNSLGQVLPYSLMPDYCMYNQPGEVMVFATPKGLDWRIEDLLRYEVNFSSTSMVEDGFVDYYGQSQDEPGTFSIGLSAGQQMLMAFREGRSLYGGVSLLMGDPVEITGHAGETVGGVVLDIPIGSATVTGTISVPEDYSPGLVSLASTIVVLRDAYADDSVLGRALTTVNCRGQYVMENIPAGTYYLVATGPRLGAYISEPFTVSAGQTVTKNITFDYGCTLTGTVTSGGSPVAAARVASEVTGRFTTTAADGSYQLTGLMSGYDKITVTKSGYATKDTELKLTTGSNSQDFVLDDDVAAVTGTVRNAATSSSSTKSWLLEPEVRFSSVSLVA
ncbi:MAG: hypothetical protein DRQ02_12195 [Candidatus Latescibacterota bacterium]|nr:MAG: hypothetical protein DRQ02_12195 [Candidatus Latescibacterota bacterium]